MENDLNRVVKCPRLPNEKGHACMRCGLLECDTTMSMFNEEWCCPACIAEERLAPRYPVAKAEHLRQTRGRESGGLGNQSFPGIGLTAEDEELIVALRRSRERSGRRRAKPSVLPMPTRSRALDSGL